MAEHQTFEMFCKEKKMKRFTYMLTYKALRKLMVKNHA